MSDVKPIEELFQELIELPSADGSQKGVRHLFGRLGKTEWLSLGWMTARSVRCGRLR